MLTISIVYRTSVTQAREIQVILQRRYAQVSKRLLHGEKVLTAALADGRTILKG